MWVPHQYDVLVNSFHWKLFNCNLGAVVVSVFLSNKSLNCGMWYRSRKYFDYSSSTRRKGKVQLGLLFHLMQKNHIIRYHKVPRYTVETFESAPFHLIQGNGFLQNLVTASSSFHCHFRAILLSVKTLEVMPHILLVHLTHQSHPSGEI